MSYIALYRKWRPLVFEDVVEQEHVVKTLKNSVSTGRIAHAYLFSGTRGTGKTTIAKIFSRAVNCLNPRDGDPCNECEVCRGILSGTLLDVVEIDAASNNSVDNVREIRDEVIYTPSRARYKVYIIDEVHMLSSGAFNALLKTLEEPPRHVVFILATTEPHKLPATVLSRCQRFDFRRISVESIVKRLEEIAGAGGLTLQKDAGRLIAKMSEGSLRDAISILDQCISLGGREVTYEDVMTVAGVVNDSFIAELADAVRERDVGKILELIEKLVMEGKDIAHFVDDVVHYFRNLMVCKISPDPGAVIEASREELETMKRQSEGFSQDEIIQIIKELSALEPSMKWTSNSRILLEVSLIKLCEDRTSPEGADMARRLAALEARVNHMDLVPRSEPGEAIPPGKAETGIKKRKAPTAAVRPHKPVGQGGGGKRYLESWSETVKELKSTGKMVLYTYLMDTKALILDDKFVGIVFKEGSSFNKTFVSKLENMEVIEAALSKSLGREVRVKCLEESDVNDGPAVQEAEEKDELVEKARDIAQKLNVPLNIIDE
ncbi:MAG: DNA polymerase III subunit gamma/tau [Clostridiales bacterium]|nr:DNA polymerase III subunit gamma/tau [Eubacteriales bacterium]MDH7567698.1 DNA polymerase III subunit gamma/tau [Clostridiales bacterium]